MKGEWIDMRLIDEWHCRVGKCSVCKKENIFGLNFCPNCGADMRETLKDPEKRRQAGLDFDGDWVDFYNNKEE